MHLPALWLVLLLVLPSNARKKIRRPSPEESGKLFEGDIVLPEEEEELLEDGEASAGIIGSHYRWAQATIVPYLFGNDFNSSELKILTDAMVEISEKTCIRFRRRKGDSNYIFFRDGEGCSSLVGRRGTVIHELVHAIGFWHEQSRTDRDYYVTINLDYVPKENRHNFDKYTTQQAYDFGVPYDFDSVMHYPNWAFVNEEGLWKGAKSIVPEISGVKIGQRTHLSRWDALKINRMYECPERIPVTTTTTESSWRNLLSLLFLRR
ncbi:unnamed protein product [Allacma fusca]|uniref:Peptidase M12A domain-containing protein n=1 Tax=Allacma fusca TaxID=39272 RepID=A0A8J2L292_9HEXA|nr:unnamed protein product [Allacma fusca]